MGVPRRVVIAGIGNEWRRDDAVGPAVAREVARLGGGVENVGPVLDPLELLERWNGASLAVVVDAVRSGAPPGTVHIAVLEGHGAPVRARPSGDWADGAAGTSTHRLGLRVVLGVARALGRGPRRVVMAGIEGQDFGDGVGLSPAVARAVPRAARRITELLVQD